MVKFHKLLLEITESSEEAVETLKDMLKLPKAKYNTEIIKYLCLVDDLLQQIDLLVKVHYLDTGEEEMKRYIRMVYQYASKLMDMGHNLSKAAAKENYADLLKELKTPMIRVQENLSKLAWEVLSLYGPREAMTIVTPGYQVLSGIWLEYRRFVLPMEA